MNLHDTHNDDNFNMCGDVFIAYLLGAADMPVIAREQRAFLAEKSGGEMVRWAAASCGERPAVGENLLVLVWEYGFRLICNFQNANY